MQGNLQTVTNTYADGTLSHQEASSVVAFSSQAPGNPATDAADGQQENGWLPSTIDTARTLTLGFAHAVYACGLDIYECYPAGCVTNVLVRNAATGMFESVWAGKDPSTSNTSSQDGYFGITFALTPYLVDAVQVTVNSVPSPIDCVVLWGVQADVPAASLGDPSCTTQYVYDKLDRKIEEIDPTPATGQSAPTTSYTYDPDGNLTQVTDPNGNVTIYKYDEHDHKTAVIQELGVGFSGFESPDLPAGSFAYSPSITGSQPWAFTGTAGIASNGSEVTKQNPNAPDGTQVAFLQTTGNMTESVQLDAGNYTLSFLAAQRASNSHNQVIEVKVDNEAATLVDADVTPTGTQYQAYQIPFTIGATTTLPYVVELLGPESVGRREHRLHR